MIARFLETWMERGEAELVPEAGELLPQVMEAGSGADDKAALGRLLRRRHAEAVLHAPGAPFGFHEDAARWGARMIFRVACFVTFRDIGEREVRQGLGEPMPEPESADAQFNADLCLGELAFFDRMARGFSDDDPLIGAIAGIARQAPLSGVGTGTGVIPDPASVVLSDPRLLQLLAERALERGDRALLELEPVRVMASVKLGAFAESLGKGMLQTVT